MKSKQTYLVLGLVLMLAAVSGTSFAKDAVQASVTPLGNVPLMTVNGNDAYHAGTYSVGTIQVLYVVNAYSFTIGSFDSFRLDMQDVHLSNAGQAPAYPVNLSLSQTGSNNLVLQPDLAALTVTEPTGNPLIFWTGSTTVFISIPAGVSNEDGTVLVGNLQMSTSSGAHLDTVTTIQVKIALVHPDACLSLVHFVSDEAFETVQPTTVIHLKNGNIWSSNPGQFSDNVLVVNTCGSEQQFDLKYTLDPRFDTNPSNNPGNAVFTFLSEGSLDASSSLQVLPSLPGDPQGQQLCLQNMNVPSGSTFIATVHMDDKKGNDPGVSPFSFVAQILVPTTASGACGTGGQNALSSNPVIAILPFTIQ